MGPADREIELLEKQLDDADENERAEIMREIRDIESEMARREQWEDHGRNEGWL